MNNEKESSFDDSEMKIDNKSKKDKRMKKSSKLLSEGFSKSLLFIGLFLLLSSLILFFWNDYSFNVNHKINSEKVGQFGDLVGGLIGSIWALAGVILFYIALTEQRRDFQTNREVLNTQAEALKQQIVEFGLQREELVETRKIYQIQSDTLKRQQFESTFFNLINLHHKIVSSIDLKTTKQIGFSKTPITSETTMGRDCFVIFANGLERMYEREQELEKVQHLNGNSISEIEIINRAYGKFYKQYQSDLSHYFRNLYHIIKFIMYSDVEEKTTYFGLVRAQLSNYELLIIFYNCISDYGKDKFLPMAKEYRLFKNLDPQTLIDKSHEELWKKSIEN